MPQYDPKKTEEKWQKKWLEERVFRAKDDSPKQKYYQLETFPYPSAAGIHMGHPKGYVAEDIHARYMRMQGREVLYTMGWDAFGLPTENYAIKIGKAPKEVAAANIENFRKQVRMFGFSYDWDREVNTSAPDYYKWTQWLFIQLFKKGLAYRAQAKVNWCPKDQTVLANEQVVDGRCERCGSVIEERNMEQWFLKITDYADRLLADLKGLDWPAATVKRQEDWIGRSEGALIKFPVVGAQFSIEVFTTRPDTLFGATYMVLAPEHPLVDQMKDVMQNWQEVAEYVDAAKHKTDLMRQEDAREKTGVELKGVTAVNPATQKEIPVWVADYVLGSYGTGAIMAVPAHDERDFAFAQKFKLPAVKVVEPLFEDTMGESAVRTDKPVVERNAIMAIVKHWSEEKYLGLKWKKVGWRTFITGGPENEQTAEEGAVQEILEETGYLHPQLIKTLSKVHSRFFHNPKEVNRFAHFDVFYFELQDGEQKETSKEEQEKHDIFWLTKDEMTKFLSPEAHKFVWKEFTEGPQMYAGEGVLTASGTFSGMDSEQAKREIAKAVGGERKVQYRLRDWSVSRQRYWGVPIPMVHCEKCGIVPVPEKDLPVVLPDLANYRPQGMPPLASSGEFVNITCPSCGGAAKRDAETLDTFVDSSWYYFRYADPHNAAAIFDAAKVKHWLPVDLYVIGAEHTVLHLLYSRFITKFLHDEGLVVFGEPFLKLRHQGLILGADGQKMSKSKGNVVNPDELVAEFGADVIRLYMMFMGPFEDGHPWDTKGILGAERFLKRFAKYLEAQVAAATAGSAQQKNTPRSAAVHKAVKKVGEDIVQFKFNTAVSAFMILLNELESAPTLSAEDLAMLIKIANPFMPHLAQEMWSALGKESYLDFEAWPAYSAALVAEETFTLIIQVNGKVRDTAAVDGALTEEAAKQLALRSEKVQKALAGKEPKKAIYVDKKLINIVT